ncbi:MAG: retropepsin-like domain-containing protein [Chloroflexaceae bacterium]|jgi:hypothetical protein|nr:retropepsin-like domain-containing protein [Chloroflexaceae bacterium]
MLDDRTQLLFPASGTTLLPLLFEPQVLRCVAAGPGGRPLTVLLDTGTDPSAIDLGLARRLGLRLGDFALGHDAASDAVPFTETVLPWLRLGDLVIRDLYALAVDLRHMPFAVDLVLGYNILPRLVFTVDYARRTLRLSHSDLDSPAPSERGARLALSFFEHFPALSNLLLDDGVTLPLATIDTGSNGGLTLGHDLAARLGLRAGALGTRRGQGASFGGGCEVLRGTARHMQLGPFALANVDLDAPTARAGDLSRAGRANIGNRLLSRFARLTLDYERRVCVLEPGQHV